MSQDKLIVALDYPTLAEAEKLVKQLSPIVKIFKIGKELFTAEGPRVIEMVRSNGGKVFLDLKYHDIPNTVAGACVAAARLGVFMLNVHALGGKIMMIRASEAVSQVCAKEGVQRPLILAVTVLTSLNQEDLREVGIESDLTRQVLHLASLAKASGLDGVVVSAHEIAMIRQSTGREFCLVVPGVRPDWAGQDDQKRSLTPRDAVRMGAHFIVVGRPITKHADPRKAAEMVLNEINQGEMK